MNDQRMLLVRLVLGVVIVIIYQFVSVGTVHSAPPGYSSGTSIVWIDGDREEIFARTSYQCPSGPADAAPDKETWITVNSATLDATNAKAALVFGHAYAVQDGTGEMNGMTTFLSTDGLTVPSPDNQLDHTHVMQPNESGDEHSMMIISLDANKDFKVLYRFGEIFAPTDETQLCAWMTRVQLLGYIE